MPSLPLGRAVDATEVDLIAVKGQFLYRTDNKVTVMNGDTFETFELDVDVVEAAPTRPTC